MKQFFALFILSFTFISAQAETAASTQSKTFVDQTKSDVKKYYANLVGGIGVYPEVSNIDKGYNIAMLMGYYLKNVVMLELGVGVAKSQLTSKNLLFTDQRDTFNVDQYQVLTAAKYQLEEISGTNLKPNIGLTFAYTLRSYNLLNGLTNNSGKTGSSTAFDAGLGGGLDYIFNTTYAAGLDFKYMFNISNQISSNYSNPTYGYNGLIVESLQYYVAGISARMNF